jgi:hypothetical protein
MGVKSGEEASTVDHRALEARSAPLGSALG